ncbi:MAG: glycosyltransferase family 4 protein [Anaerolineae bacterium]|nr:glycosyltransferase family 4 protein [Anaerolineae bacterium]MDW8072017.1 glycosyltransferase family 1 protein [Anaerolineae bacterium]
MVDSQKIDSISPTRAMRIALNGWFWDQPTTGSGQMVRHLLPALLEADEGLEILLVLPRWAADQITVRSSRMQVVAAPCHPSHLGKVWFEQVTFPRLCAQHGADLAHIPYFAPPLQPLQPTLVTIHDLIPLVLPAYRGGPLVRLYTALVATAARRAHFILTDSQASRQDIQEHLGISRDRVRVVYLAAAPHYRPVCDAAALRTVREKYRLPEQFVLWLSGFDVRKNAAALLHAYTWVVDALGDAYPLVMAGKLPERDTPLFPDPRRIATQLGIGAAVRYPGYIAEEDKPAVYSAARVFVYPSRYEGFGLPVLEAMACGTPVVTSNVSALPELAGDAAFQVSPEDTRAIGAAIIALCVDAALHAEMRRRGLARAATFTWQRTAVATLDVYRHLLQNRFRTDNVLS